MSDNLYARFGSDLEKLAIAAQRCVSAEFNEWAARGIQEYIVALAAQDAAKAARIRELEGALGRFDPQRIGHGQSTDLRALHDAQTNARAVLQGEKQ